MTEEQCHRPRDGKKRKRTTGWLAGHTIHLEIEEVAWINKWSSDGKIGILIQLLMPDSSLHDDYDSLSVMEGQYC